MTGNVMQSVREYLELGFDPIPLEPGGKATHLSGWQRRDVRRLWKDIPEGANIGLRGGGCIGAAFIDCDDKAKPGTYDRAESWLAGLGYCPEDYPVIQTASGIGRHVYVRFAGGLSDDYCTLAPEFGAGEFRYGPGAYVVAPPSQVDGAFYKLLAGDLRQLPPLALEDMRGIIKVPDAPGAARKLRIPRSCLALLQGDNGSIGRYDTASEAEQAILTGLINAGYEFSAIESLFQRYPAPGKYQEIRAKNPREAARYLRRSYDNALEWASTHESKARRTAGGLQSWAASAPWPGRAGLSERAVFLAHTSIAHQAGAPRWAASTREQAERAGVTAPTAGAATSRLCARGLLSLVLPPTAEYAGVYEFGAEVTNLYTTLPPSVRKCKSLSNHDAFRWKGLGKSCAEVYAALGAVEVATVAELAERTGRSQRTIKRVLDVMSRLVDAVTGEYLALVERAEGNNWRAVEGVDLEHVARVVRTAGAGERQRQRHAAERRAHKRALALRAIRTV